MRPNMRSQMYGRPWYVKVADAAHRLTVLGIIGFSVYLAGGIGMTLYANRNKRFPQQVEGQQAQAQGQQAQAQEESSSTSQ